MAIRTRSKFRFLVACGTAGALALGSVSGCALMDKASSPATGAKEQPNRERTVTEAEWDRDNDSVQDGEDAQAETGEVAAVDQPAPDEKAEPKEQPVVALKPPVSDKLSKTPSGGASVGLGGVGTTGKGNGRYDPGVVVTKDSTTKPMDPPPPPKQVAVIKAEEKKVMLPRTTTTTGDEVDGTEVSGATGNSYKQWKPNPWVATVEDRYSTFAADVDTASYTQARRFINSSVIPPSASVRVEEFVNYFNYSYEPPKQGAFTVHMEGAPSPYTAGRHLVKIGIKGKVLAKAERKPANLVFLVDTSGSMSGEDRLPLAREALKVMVDNLNENDTVALVTYAGSVRDVLPPTLATERSKIFAAIDALQSGGGTSMGSGVELAYKHAVKKVSSRTVSRVIVLTDGDTNIGQNQTAEQMLGSIKNHVEEGVTLTMVGFGMGNYRDTLMEKLADAGNGNCFYIDSMKEAKRVFQEKLAGTLEVIAKDVKLQVEFHPEAVAAYRLVGYENRDIADKDFRNDKVDAGEIGAGHTVTALYEIQLTGKSNDIATVRIRAKEPSGTTAKEAAFTFGKDRMRESIDEATTDFRFAAAVAGTADILRGNPQTEGWSLATAEKLAKGSAGENPDRQEFVRLVQKARVLLGDVNVAAR